MYSGVRSLQTLNSMTEPWTTTSCSLGELGALGTGAGIANCIVITCQPTIKSETVQLRTNLLNLEAPTCHNDQFEYETSAQTRTCNSWHHNPMYTMARDSQASSSRAKCPRRPGGQTSSTAPPLVASAGHSDSPGRLGPKRMSSPGEDVIHQPTWLPRSC